MTAPLERIFRDEWGRVLATLIGLLGDFDLAEEAAQDAFATAAARWERDGVPANPRAWLVSAGRFKAIDTIRRRARFDASLAEMAEDLDEEILGARRLVGDDEVADGDDERRRGKDEPGDQLSGGEKALGAISFLFALFLAKPCPFYLLDEVEAALDDTNITRFVDLLRRYADRAQFVVITHQKRTMEAADVLYGVTMGDDGVSQIVSRRLPRDERAAATA